MERDVRAPRWGMSNLPMGDQVTAGLASLPNRYSRRTGVARDLGPQLVGLRDRGKIEASWDARDKRRARRNRACRIESCSAQQY